MDVIGKYLAATVEIPVTTHFRYVACTSEIRRYLIGRELIDETA